MFHNRNDFLATEVVPVVEVQPYVCYVTGGRVLSLEYMKKVHSWATERGIPVHLDGARVFNAAESLGASRTPHVSLPAPHPDAQGGCRPV